MMIKTLTPELIHFAIADKIKSGESYIDALCQYAKETEIEIELLAAIVKKSEILKTKLKIEAKDLRLLKAEDEGTTLFDKFCN